MSNKRVIGIGTGSNIYHKHGCRYEYRMLSKNKLEISKKDARRQGYRCCRYCNSMNHHYNEEWSAINHYQNRKNMEIKFENGIVYVKTGTSLWKLVYSRHEEKIALYHRNTSSEPIDMKHLEQEQFHRQKDIQYAGTLQQCLSYIYEHDKYREAVERGDKNIHYSSKKYERRAAKSERRRSISRVNYLFGLLEGQNAGYKQLACW